MCKCYFLWSSTTKSWYLNYIVGWNIERKTSQCMPMSNKLSGIMQFLCFFLFKENDCSEFDWIWDVLGHNLVVYMCEVLINFKKFYYKFCSKNFSNLNISSMFVRLRNSTISLHLYSKHSSSIYTHSPLMAGE